MKPLFKILILSAVLPVFVESFISCKDIENSGTDTDTDTVITYKIGDCGDVLYVWKGSGVIPDTNVGHFHNFFLEANLPKEYKQEGLILKISYVKTLDDGSCMGYPRIELKTVEKFVNKE